MKTFQDCVMNMLRLFGIRVLFPFDSQLINASLSGDSALVSSHTSSDANRLRNDFPYSSPNYPFLSLPVEVERNLGFPSQLCELIFAIAPDTRHFYSKLNNG